MTSKSVTSDLHPAADVLIHVVAVKSSLIRSVHPNHAAVPSAAHLVRSGIESERAETAATNGEGWKKTHERAAGLWHRRRGGGGRGEASRVGRGHGGPPPSRQSERAGRRLPTVAGYRRFFASKSRLLSRQGASVGGGRRRLFVASWLGRLGRPGRTYQFDVVRVTGLDEHTSMRSIRHRTAIETLRVPAETQSRRLAEC